MGVIPASRPLLSVAQAREGRKESKTLLGFMKNDKSLARRVRREG